MTSYLVVLALVAIGAGVLALLAKRALDGADHTVTTFDDVRRDLRLAVVELRVERDRVARRVDDLHRRS
jgi:NADPH-dependent 2,4-dienoyl-CoA reductase/sulfur reductase-like enzyme